jgi:hypothetical protein
MISSIETKNSISGTSIITTSNIFSDGNSSSDGSVSGSCSMSSSLKIRRWLRWRSLSRKLAEGRGQNWSMLVYSYGNSSRVWSNGFWNGRIWFGDWSRKLVNKCGILQEKIVKWNRITKFIRSSIIKIDSSIKINSSISQ